MTTFTRYDDLIYLKPAPDGAIQPADHPNVVIIFGWMDAQLPHLHKYTRPYEEMYPKTTIILVQNFSNLWLRRRSYWEGHLASILEILKGLGYLVPENDQPPARILFHSFSNGGGLNFVYFSGLLRWFMPRNFHGPKPICAYIIDSSPGGEDRDSAVRAFIDPIQRPLLRSFFTVVIIVLYTVLQFFGELFGRPHPIVAYKKDLNRTSSPDDPSKPDLVSPWFTLKTPRLYLFSKSDTMVSWKEIEAHAEAAKQSGLNVRMEIFEDTPHCAHGRAHPERYWAAVRDTWNDALKVDTSI